MRVVSIEHLKSVQSYTDPKICEGTITIPIARALVAAAQKQSHRMESEINERLIEQCLIDPQTRSVDISDIISLWSGWMGVPGVPMEFKGTFEHVFGIFLRMIIVDWEEAGYTVVYEKAGYKAGKIGALSWESK